MLFNSYQFFIFLPIVITLFYLLKHKYRWILLLLASYYFYASWKIEFLSLIVFSTVLDYFISNRIFIAKSKSLKRILLIISLVFNLGLLVLFKYFDFFIGRTSWFSDLALQNQSAMYFSTFLEYMLPVGISFYTFQTISFTIDVYRGNAKPEKNIFRFALFVSYFPQLVAGPIERYNNLRPQIFSKVKFKYDNFSRGFRLILYGFFVKLVIADNLAPLVTEVFDHPHFYSPLEVALGMIAFTFQIYADFYGYSLIAIGVARLMGVKLMNNFKTPLFSSSIKEFWSRWHISLSTWFKDYLYIPLGGNRKGLLRWCFAIVMVFLVSGLWHGAEMGFIVWGAIHAGAYLIEHFLGKLLKFQKRLFTRIIGGVLTFLTVVVAFVYFRVPTAPRSAKMFKALLGTTDNSRDLSYDIGPFICLVIFLVIEILLRNKRIDEYLTQLNFAPRWILYSVLILAVFWFSAIENGEFIYFQF